MSQQISSRTLVLIAFLLLLAINLLADQSLKQQWRDLSPQQRSLAYSTYRIGSMQNVGLTLTAIAWEESYFGKYQISVKSQDYGIWQANIKWFLANKGKEDNLYNRNYFATKLVTSEHFARQYAIEQILMWHSRKGNWYKVWVAYNSGTTGTTKGKQYADRILKKVKFLKRQFTFGDN